MNRAAILDAQKTGDTASLSDGSICRIGERLSKRAAGNQPAPAPAAPANPAFFSLRSASMSAAMSEAPQHGFKPAGGGLFHKSAHDLWTLERRGGGYGLTRLASEPEGFPDDKVNPDSAPVEEAPTPQDERTAYFKQGSMVTYPLGGDLVTGRVVRASHGLLDVQLKGQIDVGVPVEFVRTAGPTDCMDIGTDGDSDHERNKEDLEHMGTTLSPTAAREVKARYWAVCGALLADEILSKPPSAKLLERVGGLRRTAGARPKVSAWSALANLNGADKAEEAQLLMLTGATCRMASLQLNVPIAWSWEMRDKIADTDHRVMASIVAALRGNAEHKAYCEANVPRPVLDRAITVWKQVQAGTAPLQKVAVDQAAEAYWKAYYGDYGEEWVREIKRRVRADLISAKLQRSGVDQAAAEYWADYYGDYGDKLVDEPARASDQPEVKPDRTAAAQPARQAGDPPRPVATGDRGMPLPAPVRSRNVFAGVTKTEIEETVNGKRVAVVKTTNGYNVLVKTETAQKRTFRATMTEAAHDFRVACRLHLGIGV